MKRTKVFLVEDEGIIRNGIKRSIDWEKEGYEFAGEASDGELAYPLILKEKPDILITDIRMPFMDGLELSRLVKEKMPDIRILLLTGFEEFEYAQKAIQIGITEYLLKPISSAKLLEVLGKVRDVIQKEQEEKELLFRYSQEMRENTERDKMRFFNKLLLGNLSLGQMIEEGAKLGLDLSASCYQVLLFKLLQNEKAQEKPEELIEAYGVLDRVTESVEGVSEFQRELDGWAFLVMGDDEEQLSEREEALEQRLTEKMKEWPDLEYFGAKGIPVFRYRNIRDSFREADRIFAARFVLPPNQITSQFKTAESGEEDFQVKGIVEVESLRTMLRKFLNNGTVEEVEVFCDTYLQQMEQENLNSNILRQYLVVDSSVEILGFIRKFAPDQEMEKEAENLKNIIQKLHSISEIRNYLVEFLKKTLDLRDMASGRKYADLIEKAKKEIEENYMTEEISLNSVAVNVGMSPSYFSSVFSKEMGMTFVEYLTEVRMAKAKEYLMCSSMKMNEIAFEVGYRDPHYFSYIFKKTQGCSPKEYRGRRKE